MKKWHSRSALLAMLLASPAIILAQNAASMTGIVTDPSGAVIPNVNIVLLNPATGATYNATSNSQGTYRFADVPPGGGYRVTFSLPGFSPLTINAVSLGVSSSRTQNAKLTPGSTDTVEVTAGTGVTVDTDDATIGNNTDPKLLNELPVQDRTSGITTLFNLEPGQTSDGSTTGARTDQTNVTVDGLDVNDFGTGAYGAIVGNAPIDSVQEFKGTVAGFGANSGTGSGGQFQLVTKSGTNHFHGNINEYHRDTSTVANSYFNNEFGLPRTPLIRNQFGGNIGGPIKHDKIFFFFDYSNSRIIANENVTRTVPLDSFRNGFVSYINNGTGCSDNSRQNTQPGCISQLNPTQVAALDPAHIGDNTYLFNLITTRYPHANDLTGGDGINTGSYRFNAPDGAFTTGYVGRIDYQINSRMSLFGRGTVSRENAVQSPILFAGDPETYPFVDRSFGYVGGFNWQIGSNKTNQFIYGETVANYLFPVAYAPEKNFNLGFATGTTTLMDSAYPGPGGQGREIPIPEVADNFSWQKGHHGLSMGGSFKWIHSSDFSLGDFTSVGVGLGGEIQSLNASLRPADIFNSSTGASFVTYDSAYAAALGRVASLSGSFNYSPTGAALPQGSGDQRHYQYYQTELYIGDAWKITPHLTINYGLNYQLYSVPYETDGYETVQNTTFDKYFYARVAASAAGAEGPNAVPFISYVLGGKKNHGPNIYAPQYNNLAPRVAFAYNPKNDPKTVFNGSAGIVYDRTVINAIQFQQDGFSYLFQQPLEENFGSAGNATGTLLNASRLGADLPSLVVVPSTPKPPFTPYVDATGNPYGLANGGAFNISVDPKLRTPYSILANFGIQHEFPQGFVMKLNYVGRFGRRLLAQADANQIVEFPDPVSGQLFSTAFGNITKEARAGVTASNLPAEPWFENVVTPGVGVANGYANNTQYVAAGLGSYVQKGDFADSTQSLASAGLIPENVGMGAQFAENTFFTNKGFSSYNGLLATLQKNLGHGLQFDVNYTFSHSIDNVSEIANHEAFGGYGFVCNVLNPRECRGTSDFDITHIITSDQTYALPFGRGQMFLGHVNRLVDEAIGGWAVSGITSWHSGAAYSTVSSAFVAGYANDAPAIFNGNQAALRHQIHKNASGTINLYADPVAAVNAFQGPIGFQIGSRNNLRGPSFFNQDLGLAKTFPIMVDRGINLKFRADAFNAFNHVSFNSPGTETSYDDVTQTGNFGQLTSQATSPRVIQLALRLEF